MQGLLLKAPLFMIFWVISIAVCAGSLTPPPGVPGTTMKPLNEVEPRTAIRPTDIPLFINKSGSYYLAGDVKTTTTGTGINISASNVTIDLNGYTLEGPGTAGSTNAIRCHSPFDNIVVKNGTVSKWPGNGIEIATSTTLLENVTSRYNGGTGFQLETGTLLNCLAEENGNSGISFFADNMPGESLIRNCRSINNKGMGIHIITPVTIENCMLSGNRDSGILAFSGHGLITNNVCKFNGQDGIIVGGTYMVVENNLCVGNTGRGISSSNGRVEHNECVSNGVGGFVFNTGTFAARNVARQNPSNYSIQGTPVYGPIVNMAAGGVIVSEHPWANFAY